MGAKPDNSIGEGWAESRVPAPNNRDQPHVPRATFLLKIVLARLFADE